MANLSRNRTELSVGINARGARRGARQVNSSLESMERKTEQVRRAGAGLSRVFAGLGVAIGAGAAIRTLSSYSDEMAKIRAVTGATELQFRRLDAEAKRLGITTRFSASEAASGMTELARAGFNVEEVLDSVQHTLTLAQAGAVGLADAAGIAAAAINAFRLEASEMERVADAFIYTANNTFNTVQTLADSFRYAAPIASALGVSLEETLGVLGVLGDVGLQGSLAGTALRGLLSILQELGGGGGAGTAKQELKELGIEAGKIDVIANGLVASLAQLRDSGVEPNALLAIFRRRQAGSAITLLRDFEKFQELVTEIERSKGTAREAATIMDDSLGGALKRLLSATEGVVLAFGEEGLLGRMRGTVEIMADSLRTLAAAAKTIGPLLAFIANKTLLLGAIFAGWWTTRGVLRLFRRLRRDLRLISRQFIVFGARARAATSVTMAWAAATTALGRAFRIALGPVGILATSLYFILSYKEAVADTAQVMRSFEDVLPRFETNKFLLRPNLDPAAALKEFQEFQSVGDRLRKEYREQLALRKRQQEEKDAESSAVPGLAGLARPTSGGIGVVSPQLAPERRRILGDAELRNLKRQVDDVDRRIGLRGLLRDPEELALFREEEERFREDLRRRGVPNPGAALENAFTREQLRGDYEAEIERHGHRLQARGEQRLAQLDKMIDGETEVTELMKVQRDLASGVLRGLEGVNPAMARQLETQARLADGAQMRNKAEGELLKISGRLELQNRRLAREAEKMPEAAQRWAEVLDALEQAGLLDAARRFHAEELARIKESIEAQDELRLAREEANRPFNRYTESLKNTRDLLEEAFVDASRTAGDALAEFFLSGQRGFTELRQVAQQFLKDLLSIGFQRSVTQPLAEFLFGTVASAAAGSLFPGVGGGGSSGGSSGASRPNLNARTLNPATGNFDYRYPIQRLSLNTGGFSPAGVPTYFHRDELRVPTSDGYVFNRRETTRMLRPNIRVNIQNSPGTPRVAQRRADDGYIVDVIYPRVRDALVGEVVADKGQPFAQALAARDRRKRSLG